MAQGILKYCLRGMLGKKQRETFFFFLDTISKLLHESQVVSELDTLELDMNRALALMERDFPMAKQVQV